MGRAVPKGTAEVAAMLAETGRDLTRGVPPRPPSRAGGRTLRAPPAPTLTARALPSVACGEDSHCVFLFFLQERAVICVPSRCGVGGHMRWYGHGMNCVPLSVIISPPRP